MDLAEPIDPGGGFLPAYFHGNKGIRLEIGTRVEGFGLSVVQSARSNRFAAKAELETLFDDPADMRNGWTACRCWTVERTPQAGAVVRLKSAKRLYGQRRPEATGGKTCIV